ncbi:MAG: HD domain-containing protein [Clostridia bacterium]|nr:HD domain-containing protein [Clostridia bacterium]
MDRVNRIYNHPIFRERTETIREAEKGRKFCRHDLVHALDVARIGRIMILEEALDLDIELFYAAALLHDAGRYSGIPHNESGARLAERLMPLCGFSAEETALVSCAIREHRITKSSTDFSRILYTADKLSRNCFTCEASDECYWDNDKRNHKIEI